MLKFKNSQWEMETYLAKVNEEDCVGCGTYVEMCNSTAIELVDTVAVINSDRCLGCGICSHHLP